LRRGIVEELQHRKGGRRQTCKHSGQGGKTPGKLIGKKSWHIKILPLRPYPEFDISLFMSCEIHPIIERVMRVWVVAHPKGRR
jgi:hypothetical protein